MNDIPNDLRDRFRSGSNIFQTCSTGAAERKHRRWNMLLSLQRLLAVVTGEVVEGELLELSHTRGAAVGEGVFCEKK